MRVNLEPDPQLKLHQLASWANNFQHLDRRTLINLGTNPKQKVKNINVRHDALIVFGKRLEDMKAASAWPVSLTDEEVEKLYNLIIDEEDFPILVDTNEIVVEEITHLKEQEDELHKKGVKRDIEENIAVLKAEALFLIVDFGAKTKRFSELRSNLIIAITGILENMLCEPDQLFVKEKSETGKVIISFSFINYVEALYFIDKESAKPFMEIFNIPESNFSFERRRKAS